MKTEAVISFLKKRNHRIFFELDNYWYNEYHHKHIYTIFPPQKLAVFSDRDLDSIIKKNNISGLRYFSPPDSGPGMDTCRWICTPPYDLNNLSSKVRNRTKFGLKNCDVRLLDWEELVSLAAQAHADTMKRRGEDHASLGFGEELKDCPAYEAWGAFFNKQLIAYLIILVVEDWAHIIVQRSSTDYLKFYPNNALVYTILTALFARGTIKTVSYGYDSVSANASLGEFKESMGFKKEAVKQHLYLNVWLRWVINKNSLYIAERFASFLEKLGIRLKLRGRISFLKSVLSN